MEKRRSQSNAPSLWTKNFTIITVGSVVSMLGNSLSGFAMSLLVLDYTQSSFYYSIYLVVYTFPQLLMPILSGALLDRVSRRKTIYTLDFITSGVYLSMALILGNGYFSFFLLLLFSFIMGSIQSIYMVAYQSFYPLLITEGNFSKAYSISSVLETLAMFMVPVAAFVYNLIGIVPLFAFNVVCFLTAATMETRIDAVENYIEKRKDEAKIVGSRFRMMFSDIIEGLKYLGMERGLLMIAIYFGFNAFSYGASSVIILPYFKANFANGEYFYMIVMGLSTIGRGIGGAVWYRHKIPNKWKFGLAMASYIGTALLEGFVLYMPVPLMMVSMLISGLLGVTSYTIRTSATQSYVPDERKGRFNGAFNLLSTVGNLGGEMLAGSLTILFPERMVLTGFMIFNAAAAIIFVGGHKKDVKYVYERSA